jgi:hypothetical protein
MAMHGNEVNDMADEITRKRMRGAILTARDVIAAARVNGEDVKEPERLLSEALAASYRLDYIRAYNLAKKATDIVVRG